MTRSFHARSLSLFALILLPNSLVWAQGPGGGPFTQPNWTPVDLILQEALPAGESGTARTNGVATFGIPFYEGLVPTTGQNPARPALRVVGSPSFQFEVLDLWPDGTVRWALCSTQADIAAAGSTTVQLDRGNGARGTQNPLVTVVGNTYKIDTLALEADVTDGQFRLFENVEVGGQLLAGTYEDSVRGFDEDGCLLRPGDDTVLSLEYNGPTRAVIRADGTLVVVDNMGSSSCMLGDEIVDFTCRITAERNSPDLTVDFTVRNAGDVVMNPTHVTVRSIELATKIAPGARPEARVSTATAHELEQLATGESLYLYQAYSTAPTSDMSEDYFPHIPKEHIDHDNDPNTKEIVVFSENGYRVNYNGTDIVLETDQSIYPKHPHMMFDGDLGGVTIGIQDMPYMWPAALEAHADGTVVAGIFTEHNPAKYTFLWRQHESRRAVFSFFTGNGASIAESDAVIRKLDAPFTGRFSNYLQYDVAGVFPYRLLTVAQQDSVYADMGLSSMTTLSNESLEITRYLAKSTTGGSNNSPLIENRLAAKWLRHGLGGTYRKGVELALYKSEWQVPRSDGLLEHGAVADPIPDVPGSEVTMRTFGDKDHRYREGMILAYFLTGDTRFDEAIHDEVSVLLDEGPDDSNTRSMAQTLRAQVLLYERKRDPRLLEVAYQRMIDWDARRIVGPIDETTGGTGWDGAPGAGTRGFYVSEGDTSLSSVPKLEARGFFAATLAPNALFHAARVFGNVTQAEANATMLSLGDIQFAAGLAQDRLLDISRWTKNELFGRDVGTGGPGTEVVGLAYRYNVPTICVGSFEASAFHPITLAMAEGYSMTLDVDYLCQGVAQANDFENDGKIEDLHTRLEIQHFLALLRDNPTVCNGLALRINKCQ